MSSAAPSPERGFRLGWRAKLALFVIAAGLLVIVVVGLSVLGSVAFVALLGSLWLWLLFFFLLLLLYAGTKVYFFFRRRSRTPRT